LRSASLALRVSLMTSKAAEEGNLSGEEVSEDMFCAGFVMRCLPSLRDIVARCATVVLWWCWCWRRVGRSG
jgi:hypothetical protein